MNREPKRQPDGVASASRRLLVAWPVVLAAAGALAAESDWRRHRFAEEGFSVEVPESWAAIPDAQMRRLADDSVSRRNAAGGVATRGFRYGFQSGPVQGWFKPPFVTFDIRDVGRVPRRVIDALPRAGSPDPPGVDGGCILGRLAPGESAYDEGRDVVWMHIASRGSNAPPVRLFAAIYLTQAGVIQLNASVPSGDSGEVLRTIGHMAESLEVDPGIAYQKPPFEAWPMADRLDWSHPDRRHMEIGLACLLLPTMAVIALVQIGCRLACRWRSPLVADQGDLVRDE